MADATHQYNVQDLNDRLTRYEAALEQIAASLGTYQQLASDLRRDLNAVSQQGQAPIPPPVAESREVPPVTPPVPSAEAEAARVRSAQSAGMPVNVPPVEGMAEQEQKDAKEREAAEKKDAEKDKAPPAPSVPRQTGSSTPSRSGRSGSDKE